MLAYEQILEGLRRAERNATRTANAVAAIMSLQLKPGSKEGLAGSRELDTLIQRLSTEDGYNVVVVNAQKRVVADIRRESIGQRYDYDMSNEVEKTLRDGYHRKFQVPEPGGGKPMTWVVVPVRDAAGNIGGAVLLNSYGSLLIQRQFIFEVNATITATVLLTIIFSLLLARWLSRRVAGQISGLEEGARQLGRGNLDYRIEEKGSDELASLGRAFNRMAADLKVSKEEVERNVAELRESEVRTRLLTLASHDMIWEANLLMGTSEWSETLWSFLGYSPKDVNPTVEFWRKHIHPEDVSRVISVTDAVMRSGGDSWSVEYRLRRSDGSYSDVLDRAYVVYDAERRPVRIVGAARDITEKKMSERKLAESESSFRLSFANNPYPMFTYDLETLRFLEVNEALTESLGYSRGELLEMTLTDIHPREDVPRLMKNLSERRPVLQHSGEWRHRRKDGSTIDVQIDSHALEFMGRRAALVMAQDITKRKEVERRLTQSEVRFRSLIERSSDIFSIIDAGGRIVYMSPAVSRMGFTAEELTGKTAFDLVHPDDSKKLIEALRMIVGSSSVVQTFSMRFRRRDGSWRDSESVVLNMLDVPEIRGIVVNSRDVTEKKRLEAQFLRAQRLESIGTLAGGIAHDLNNVLAPIILSFGMLRRMALDESGTAILDTIETSARRGADLIKQVLSFARGMEGERALIQMRHLAEEVVKIIKATFPRSISISTNLPKNLWTILGDATQLHQVLMNLCVNARDAMPNGGNIDISAENVMLDEQFVRSHFESTAGPNVLLSITDTGTGIPRHMIDRIFEPFFTTKEPGKGTGLGLSTVLTIVRSHGGAVYVYSEEGKGTTFKIYLPAQVSPAQPLNEEAESEKYVGNGELILVVDDEAAVRTIAKTILDAYGYRTIVAVDGQNGMEQFVERKDEIALVITDMMMPRLDGAATIRSMRRINPKMRIIVMSGLPQSGNIPGIGEMEFSLTKPFTSEALLQTVQRALTKS